MYLDVEKLDAVDAHAFRARSPYPWVNPPALLTSQGFRELHACLPEVERFKPVFGKERKYGQQSHDRYTLEYEAGLDLPEPWRALIAELEGDLYRQFLERILGVRDFRLRFHWHYTPRGCSVSPHCDAKHKLGSHIFYFNTSEDWNADWGGETVILDDGGRFHSDSNPAFGDFVKTETSITLDNHSLIFLRDGDSWHGVREITAPEGALRKVFIVVFEAPGLGNRIRSLLGLA